MSRAGRKPRVLFTDPTWALDEAGRPDRARAGVEAEILGDDIDFDLGPFDRGYRLSGPRLLAHAAGADALVVHRCPVTPELIEVLAPTCRVVARSGVGTDNLDLPALEAAGIGCFNVADYCGDEVTTHTAALLLALERGVCVQDRLVRGRRWAVHAGGVPRRVSRRTVGIVGFGRIGRAGARKLGPFYDRVLAYDPYVSADLMAGHGVGRVDSLAELVARCDAVVVHAALTDETAGMIDAEVLEAARPGLLLVNTARGRIVETGAVLRALEAGVLGGFAADVFAPEDPNDDPVAAKLLDRDDVIVTAHRAFLSTESELSLRRRVTQAVAEVLRGLPMRQESWL